MIIQTFIFSRGEVALLSSMLMYTEMKVQISWTPWKNIEIWQGRRLQMMTCYTGNKLITVHSFDCWDQESN